MFLIDYIRYAFDFPNIIARRREPFIKVFAFFVFMVLIGNIPHIINIIQTEGWTISFVSADFNQNAPTYGTFELPTDLSIHYYGLESTSDDETQLIFENYLFVFNAKDDSYDTNLEQILLQSNQIIYIDLDGNELIGSYRGFTDTLDLNQVMLDPVNWQANMISFADSIEAGFSRYIIFYSILSYSSVQLLSTGILLFAISLILMLFRFGHSHFMTYFEGLKMLAFSLPIPVFIGFIVGFFIDPMTPFIIQFGMGLITMLVMVKYGKAHFNG